jgi:hypothetical protein
MHLRSCRRERDQERGQGISYNRLAMAYGIEFLVIGSSPLWAKYFAEKYGHRSFWTTNTGAMPKGSSTKLCRHTKNESVSRKHETQLGVGKEGMDFGWYRRTI